MELLQLTSVLYQQPVHTNYLSYTYAVYPVLSLGDWSYIGVPFSKNQKPGQLIYGWQEGADGSQNF